MESDTTHPSFRYQFPEYVNKNNAKNTRVSPIQLSLLFNSNLDRLKKIKIFSQS